MSDDYCELCDLPLSTCVHGMPPAPPPPPAAPKAPRAPRAPRAVGVSTPRVAKTAAALARRAPRKWTPPEDFEPHILGVLEAAGGELDTEDVFAALESRLAEELLEGDRQLTPEGELRWRFAARRARQSMIKNGVMSKGAPGIWALS